MPQCDECKEFCFNRYMFRGQWVCLYCLKRLQSERDSLYYKALQEAIREK